MLSFVFWNVGGEARVGSVCGLVKGCDADFVLLAECGDAPQVVLPALASLDKGTFHYASFPEDKVQVFSAVAPDAIERLAPILYKRSVCYRVRPPLKPEFLLVTLHLPSKANGYTEDDLAVEASNAMDDIRSCIDRSGIDRVIIVGDFNMAPYETGMVVSNGFHSFMARSSVLPGTRQIQGIERRMFYNPTWSLLGDLFPGPPGSHHHKRGRGVEYDWYAYDQVLLSHSVAPWLASLAYVDEPRHRRRNSERPGGGGGSDHFPLRFVLDLDRT